MQKVSLQQKISHLTDKINQQCIVHQKQAIQYCSKIDCAAYSYLCQKCIKENIHGHLDQIQQFQRFIQRLIYKITTIRPSTHRIFQSQNKPPWKPSDFQRFLAQLRSTLSLIEDLQIKLNEAIRQSKMKIGGYIRKYENINQGKLNTKIQLYSNPYLIVNKINSQKNDDFILQLKRILRGNNQEPIDSFNPKYQFINLQNKLKLFVAGGNQQIFAPKSKAFPPQITLCEYSQILCESKPYKLCSRGQNILVTTQQQLLIYSSKTNMLSQRVGISLQKQSLMINQIGILQIVGTKRYNQFQLFTYIDRVSQIFTFQFQIKSLLLSRYQNNYLIILGRQNGKFSIFDYNKKSIINTIQTSHTHTIEYICNWGQNKFIVSGKLSSVSVYSVILSSQFALKLQEQIICSGQIQKILIHGQYIILLTNGKNVDVYDSLLRLHYHSINKQASQQWDFASVIFENDDYLKIIGHTKKQPWLSIILIDKQQNDDMKIQKFWINNQQIMKFLQINQNEIWINKFGQKMIKKYIIQSV